MFILTGSNTGNGDTIKEVKYNKDKIIHIKNISTLISNSLSIPVSSTSIPLY